LRTNLIGEDRLLGIFEKLERIFTGLDVINGLKKPQVLGKQPQLFLNGTELAKRRMSTMSRGGTMTPHCIKSNLHLCSGTPLGGESKQSSNVTIRKRRFETLFPTAAVS
jgi:hypothetical protein